ncbi:MAG: response regulator [Cyanobacteria bacterium P01_F01_bin.150]
MTQYQAGQLKSLLESLHVQGFYGLAHIQSSQTPNRTGCIFFNNGDIVYGSSKIPSPEEFAIEMGQRLSRGWIESSVRFASEKLGYPPSVSELLDVITRLQVLKWEELETLAYMDTVLILELIVGQAGTLSLGLSETFDLGFGRDRHSLNWDSIWRKVDLRRKMWSQMASSIPSVDAIPCLAVSSLEQISDLIARTHIKKWVDGSRPLIDIAQANHEDPLKLGRTYMAWVQAGWLTFSSCHKVDTHAPRILSVDDSPIVQHFIQKSLGSDYPLSFARSATEALTILNQEDISLILLDVTMPDIDGIEFCRIVRKIPKFRDLPIIMLTANDSFLGKMKGQFAGANHYLTKPVNRDELMAVIDQYLVPEDAWSASASELPSSFNQLNPSYL